MMISTFLTKEQQEAINMPDVKNIDDLVRTLPQTVSVSGKSYSFIFGFDNEYYAGYQTFGTYVDDYMSWSKDPLECLYNLLSYVIKKSWRAY